MARKTISLSPEDVVLELNEAAEKFSIEQYEDFIYELCGDWEFQKQAIRRVLKFFLSKEYDNSEQLLTENWNENPRMQAFAPIKDFKNELLLPDKLCCTVDLATGTGKSWVMYAVARILLASGAVDRVLILAPSRTIRKQLVEKFREFGQRSTLTDALPTQAKWRVAEITHADQTIEDGHICIENIHKTYEHVSSSIEDSLSGGRGEKTLVINDEAHHILTPKSPGESKYLRKWNAFLRDDKYSFRYVLNVTGTPYKDDQYFYDVIYHYSIRDAIRDGYVKDIYYRTKEEKKTGDQKWQAVVSNHHELKKKYSIAEKHITIVVTSSISNCDKLAEELKSFLKAAEGLSDDEAERKILVVSSSSRHAENVEQLQYVDNASNPVEWIVSVSMLTEGWDVKNVFQIYPHESRAFNSKLLISQVLGRGLRIPQVFREKGIQPVVWVFNHDAWKKRIDNLVEEVAEIRSELASRALEESQYHFGLHVYHVEKEISSTKVESKEAPEAPSKITFQSTPRDIIDEWESVKEQRKYNQRISIENQIVWYTVEEAANDIFTNLYLFDMRRGTDFTQKVGRERIKELLKDALKEIKEEKISEANLQRGKAAFNVLFRRYTGVSRIEEGEAELQELSTQQLGTSVMSESFFKRHGSLFTSKQRLNDLPEDDRKLIREIRKELDSISQTSLVKEDYVKGRVDIDIEEHYLKTPLNIVLVSHNPEREFTELLVKHHPEHVDAWVKSPSRGFYGIPYIHRPGTHSLQRTFNPDFILKRGNRRIFVEIKSTEDSTIVNKDKVEGASTYFEKLNLEVKELRYEFYLLEPRDYPRFFADALAKETQFVGALHDHLRKTPRAKLKEGR